MTTRIVIECDGLIDGRGCQMFLTRIGQSVVQVRKRAEAQHAWKTDQRTGRDLCPKCIR